MSPIASMLSQSTQAYNLSDSCSFWCTFNLFFNLSFTINFKFLLVSFNCIRLQSFRAYFKNACNRGTHRFLFVRTRYYYIVSYFFKRNSSILLFKHLLDKTLLVVLLHALAAINVHVLDDKLIFFRFFHSLNFNLTHLNYNIFSVLAVFFF